MEVAVAAAETNSNSSLRVWSERDKGARQNDDGGANDSKVSGHVTTTFGMVQKYVQMAVFERFAHSLFYGHSLFR